VTHLDGNAIGGLLSDVFGRDVTDTLERCRECGTENFVGALHVYRAAGVVVRCPTCHSVLMRFVESREQVWVDLSGLLGSSLDPLREARVHVVHGGQVVDGRA
jgi:hypothetical protein